jgi:hypothetical protein
MTNHRIFSLPLTVLFLLGGSLAVHAQLSNLKIGTNLKAINLGAWRRIQPGVEFRKIVFERIDPSYQVDFKIVRFDAQIIAARILHSRELHLGGASSKTFAEKSGAIAAINANYFDEKGRALAYLKTAEGEINRTVSMHALYTGVFGLRDGAPFITHRDEFDPKQASEALQSGPLLFYRGNPVEVMRGLSRFARRSVIGIDKTGRVIVAATDAIVGGLSFAELQDLFSNPQMSLNATELLSLDGGGSSQLYLRAGKFEESVVGTADVPVAIGFFAKSQ